MSDSAFGYLFAGSPEPAAISTATDEIIDLNAAFSRLLGRSREDLIGTCLTGTNLVLRSRELGDGHRLWTCPPDGVLALSEARLAALGEATFEGLALTRGGKIADCNAQLAAMWGYSIGEIIGIRIVELTAPESRELVADKVATNSEGPYQHTGVRKDGSRFPVEVRARMIEHEGSLVRVTAVRDLTEHQRVIKELRARTGEMEQFVYTVSHDLKSPLVTIKGFLGAIAADRAAGQDGSIDRDLARIANAADKMTELLDDLLELSRAGHVGTLSARIPLGDVARAAIDLVAGALTTSNATVELGALPSITGDRGRLTQVFQNLIENAVKYMGAQPAPRIEIGARSEGEQTLVFVRDNGIGLAAPFLERIFAPFEKLDPRSPGTGIGLSLVRRIVEFHGGTIRAESAGLGHGTTFVLVLPLEPTMDA